MLFKVQYIITRFKKKNHQHRYSTVLDEKSNNLLPFFFSDVHYSSLQSYIHKMGIFAIGAIHGKASRFCRGGGVGDEISPAKV